MTPDLATYPGYRFPAEIVFSLSFHGMELILAERGIEVTHIGAGMARRLRRRPPKLGDIWHLDEVFLRMNGKLHYLWRDGPARRRARHPGARPTEHCGHQALLQAPARRAQV
jgi:hypothetical protein